MTIALSKTAQSIPPNVFERMDRTVAQARARGVDVIAPPAITHPSGVSMTIALSKTAQSIPPNVFERMDRTVAQARARGVDVIDLSKGNPDGFPEARIRAEAKAAVDRPENARYTPFDGKPLFLQAAAAWYAHEHSVALDPGTQLFAVEGAVDGRPENARYTPFDGKPLFLQAAAAWYAHEHSVALDPGTQLFAVEGAVDGLAAAFRYTPFDGKPLFLQAAAAWYAHEHSVALDPGTQLFAVEGAVDGLAAAFAVLLDPGDVVAFVDPYYPSYHCMARMLGAEERPLPAHAELGWLPDFDAVPGETWDRVKLLDPYYPSYHCMARMLGAEERPLPAHAELGWLPDFDAVPGETWDRVKLLVLNYPNNPTGAQAPPRFFARAVELAVRHGFAIVHDFAYASLGVHENQKSLLAVPGAREVGLEIVSLSKMYAMAGWRAGFVAGNEQLVAAVKQYHYQMGSMVTSFVQDAGAAALAGDQAFVREQAARYAARRAIVAEVPVKDVRDGRLARRVRGRQRTARRRSQAVPLPDGLHGHVVRAGRRRRRARRGPGVCARASRTVRGAACDCG